MRVLADDDSLLVDKAQSSSCDKRIDVSASLALLGAHRAEVAASWPSNVVTTPAHPAQLAVLGAHRSVAQVLRQFVCGLPQDRQEVVKAQARTFLEKAVSLCGHSRTPEVLHVSVNARRPCGMYFNSLTECSRFSVA